LTVEDVISLFKLFQTEYEKFDYDKDKVMLWAAMLADYPCRVVQIASMTVIAKSPYPPKLSDIIAALREITTPESDKTTAAEAWGEVMKALGSYGIYRADEAMQSFSPKTQKVVKYIGYREICNCEELSVMRGQFLKMFEQIVAKDKQDRLLPAALKKEIQQLADSKSLIGGDTIEKSILDRRENSNHTTEIQRKVLRN
jgi:hypothetical protein